MHAAARGIVVGTIAAALTLGPAPAGGAPPTATGARPTDVQVADESWHVPDDFTMRVRLTKITPNEPTAIHWRRKGEGLGGRVIRGTLSEEKLPVGRWSPPVKVNSLAQKGAFPAKMFLTVTAGRPGRTERGPDGRRVRVGHSTLVEFEFEFRHAAKRLKTLTEAGPDGGTVGIVIPAYRLAGGKTPADADFLAELTGILEYAARRAERLEKLPWASWPRPRRYAILNNIGGYGEGIGYGIRMTNKAVVAAECRSLRQLGVNGFRSGPDYLMEMVRQGKGFAKDFGRAYIAHVMGYPVPVYRSSRRKDPEAGCPYAPGVAQRTEEGLRAALEVRKLPVEEVWGLTVDEIGTVIDGSPEGKGHLSVCPRCAEGFREYLKHLGLAPGDFGRRTWDEIAPAKVWRPRQPKAKPTGPKPPKLPAAFQTDQEAAPKPPKKKPKA
ncbi:MAG TPA: hypothetical protein VM031_03435, partial [Phycisphaerae bacterium]|nr:hypothetical protein [Phycisphaerae bacterium]